jgi:hypothetical protein
MDTQGRGVLYNKYVPLMEGFIAHMGDDLIIVCNNIFIACPRKTLQVCEICDSHADGYGLTRRKGISLMGIGYLNNAML